MSEHADRNNEQKDWRSNARPNRWSARRKKEVVIRLLRGESVASISREVGIEIYVIEEWRHLALDGIETSLKSRKTDPLSAELGGAMKRIGELSMEIELLRERCRKQESFRMGRLKK